MVYYFQSSYLGGSASSDADIARGIALDPLRNVYVTGATYSSDFPDEPGYGTFEGGYDAFVTRFNPSLSALNYSAILGGSSHDDGYALTIDPDTRAAWVVGSTGSGDFPLSDNHFQSDQPSRDAFLTGDQTARSCSTARTGR
jgi:hypothetical protein